MTLFVVDLPEPADGWASSVMGEIAQVIGGGTPSAKDPANFCEEGGFPWLTPADLSGFKGTLVTRGARNLTERGLRTSSAKMLPKGTVLMSSRAPIGYLAIAANSIATNQGFKSFVLPAALEPRFVLLWLRFIQPLLEEMGSGSTFAEISGAKAKEIPLLVAPLAEQRRIVEKAEALLARASAVRERLERVLRVLKRFRQAVLAAACDGRLTKAWRTRQGLPPQDGDLPSTWQRYDIAALASAQPRSIQSGPFGSNLRHSEFRDSGRLVIGIDNVGDGIFLEGRQHRIGEEKFAELQKYAARPQDVLITVMATVGRVCVVPPTLEPAIITKHVYRISVNQDLVLPDFLALALRGAPDVRRQVHEQIRGQTRAGINGEILKSLQVAIPPIREQEEVVNCVSALSDLAARIEGRLRAAFVCTDRLPQAVLSRAFAGDLVPTEAEVARAEGRNYEPAQELLERIRTERAAADGVHKTRKPSPPARKRVRTAK